MDIIIILIITTIIILIMDIIILITITIIIIILRSGLLGTSLWSFQDTQCQRLSSLHNLEGDSADIIILAIVDHHCHQCFHRSCHFQHLPHHHRCHFQRGVKVLDWVDFLLLLTDHRLQTRNQVKIIRMLIMLMMTIIITTINDDNDFLQASLLWFLASGDCLKGWRSLKGAWPLLVLRCDTFLWWLW